MPIKFDTIYLAKKSTRTFYVHLTYAGLNKFLEMLVEEVHRSKLKMFEEKAEERGYPETDVDQKFGEEEQKIMCRAC